MKACYITSTAALMQSVTKIGTQGLMCDFIHLLCPHATFCSSIYLCLLSTMFGGCAARIHVTSFCCSLRCFGFLSSRWFARGQRRCCGIPPRSSGLCLSKGAFYSFPTLDWWFPQLFLVKNLMIKFAGNSPNYCISMFNVHCFFL
jgi:hypothetical protein